MTSERGGSAPVTPKSRYSQSYDSREIYRDATFSRATRDRIASLLVTLDAQMLTSVDERDALRDVIRRWDDNDATEFHA